mgnify:CR=1 FL=1
MSFLYVSFYVVCFSAVFAILSFSDSPIPPFPLEVVSNFMSHKFALDAQLMEPGTLAVGSGR